MKPSHSILEGVFVLSPVTTDELLFFVLVRNVGVFVVRWRFFCPLHTGVGDMVMATVRKGKPELRKKGEPLRSNGKTPPYQSRGQRSPHPWVSSRGAFCFRCIT